MAQLQAVAQVVGENGVEVPCLNTLAVEFSKEDLGFVGDIMKHDPRDRFSARELLQHPWFNVTSTIKSPSSVSSSCADILIEL